MEELFGLSMTTLMYVLLAVVLASMAALGMLAARNRVMLKMGLRPIPRRPGQTALIIVGVMLSTVIMAAAFGTGDTLSFSIRNEAVAGLRQIDVLVVPSRAGDDASFGAVYLSEERSQEIRADLASNDKIDGIMPQISDAVPVQNRRTKLTEGRMNLVGLDPACPWYARPLEGFGSGCPWWEGARPGCKASPPARSSSRRRAWRSSTPGPATRSTFSVLEDRTSTASWRMEISWRSSWSRRRGRGRPRRGVHAAP